MEKILTIDGRQVKFKSTGAFLLRYKAQFGRDAFDDLYKLQTSAEVDADGDVVSLNGLQMETLYDLIWTLAKTADPEIPPPFEWLDEFSEFPLMSIWPELESMITETVIGTVPNKKK